MLTMICDLQFGSTGKGLIAGYLSQKKEYDVVVSANMPNAGHTFVDKYGKAWINKVLPSGLYSPSLTYVCIGPGAVFDPIQLAKEIDEMRSRINTEPYILIHEAAALVNMHHRDLEKELNPISSTMQGSMEAVYQKMQRQTFGSNVVAANMDYLSTIKTNRDEPISMFVVPHVTWFNVMMKADHILAEGSQGYSLGINAGFYPYCTSRDCTVHRLQADCALPVMDKKVVIGSARVHPIRVGNTPGGTSGPHYTDQVETSWEELGREPEYTTVTKRVRRVFSFSEQQVREAILMNGVDYVFLNFCNYDPREAIRVAHVINKIGKEAWVKRGIQTFDEEPAMVKYLGFGPRAEDIMEYNHYGY